MNLVSREILTGLFGYPCILIHRSMRKKRFDDANKALTKTNLFVNRAMTFMMPLMMFVMNSIAVLIVWVGGHSINDGAMQVGDMMAFIQYTMQIIMAFLMICMISVMLPRAAVSAGRVDEVLTSETMIHDPGNPSHIPEEGKERLYSTMYRSVIRGQKKMSCMTFPLPQSLERRRHLSEVPGVVSLRW